MIATDPFVGMVHLVRRKCRRPRFGVFHHFGVVLVVEVMAREPAYLSRGEGRSHGTSSKWRGAWWDQSCPGRSGFVGLRALQWSDPTHGLCMVAWWLCVAPMDVVGQVCDGHRIYTNARRGSSCLVVVERRRCDAFHGG